MVLPSDADVTLAVWCLLYLSKRKNSICYVQTLANMCSHMLTNIHIEAYIHVYICVWVVGILEKTSKSLFTCQPFSRLIWYDELGFNCWILINTGRSYTITSMGHSKNQWVANGRRSKWWWVFLYVSFTPKPMSLLSQNWIHLIQNTACENYWVNLWAPIWNFLLCNKFKCP